jgi:signal transduction histidine kinase/AmiR/NasT family two-component response regulator
MCRTDDVEEVYQAAVEQLREALGCDAVVVLVANGRGRFRMRASHGMVSDTVLKILGDWEPWARTVRHPSTLFISDLSSFGVPPNAGTLREQGVGALAAVPLIYRGTVLGRFAALWAKPHSWSDAEVALAETVATQVAFATARKRAEDDRTEALRRQQEARAQAEAANRMKDEFLATLSHELRTPLNAIMGWARLLRTGKLDEAAADKALEIIERNSQVQGQLVDDLLDISRIITGKLRLEPRPLELHTVVETAIEAVRPAAEAKSIPVHALIDPAAGRVQGDPDRLQQVFWNLLSNAIKFTPDGGSVVVRLERIDPHVQVTVTDTGVGITDVFLPYVFDRFRQNGDSSTRQHNGLGLGLAIVKHLVELHGGTVQASSDGENRGATFTVKLPVAAIKLTSGDIEEGLLRGEHKVLADLRVLVVDDEMDARELLGAVLTNFGATVSGAASVKEAMEMFQRSRPDVLVCDIGMPGEDGYSLIRKVRALSVEDGGRTPAVALTAFARPEDRAKSLLAGFQLHVPKPVKPSELAVVVATLAGRITQVQALQLDLPSELQPPDQIA